MSETTTKPISAIADDPKAVFLATMARALHESGIATDALEETLENIADAIGIPLQIFALPTQITIAVGPRWNQKIVLMRLNPEQVNLRRISILNTFYMNEKVGF